MNKKHLHRFLLPFAILSMIAGIWAGWIRAGWDFSFSQLAMHHGGLMVGSFLGTLIIIERAITFKNRLILLIPLINALSLPLFFLEFNDAALMALMAGGLGIFILFVIISWRHPQFYHFVITAGALCYLIGSIILFDTHSYPATFRWWMAFFLLTIVGERLELSRFLNISSNLKVLLVLFLVLFIVSILLPFHSKAGDYLFSASLTLTGLWLLRYDMALKSIKKAGQFRYSASLLIVGYIWLIITAALAIFAADYIYSYDATLHAFFIGFVFSMIFAHAPIILPAVVGVVKKTYHPVLYFWFIILQISIIMRISGDLAEEPLLRYWSGMVSGIAMIFFFINMALLLVSKEKH